ncbi:MAG: VOC family protein [Alphaproteobacteria bacterium]
MSGHGLRLNQVTLGAVDMPASVAFYKNLGLKLIVDSAPRYVRFEFPSDGESEPATLSLHGTETGWQAPTDGPLIYFEVADVAAFLSDKSLTPLAAPKAQSYLWTEADIIDPSGNRIRIYEAGENRRFPPWRVEG